MDLWKSHVPACRKSEYMLPSSGVVEEVEVHAKLLKFRRFFSCEAVIRPTDKSMSYKLYLLLYKWYDATMAYILTTFHFFSFLSITL